MSMVKTNSKHYPLQLENWSDDTLIVISRGHHDLEQFSKEVSEQYDHYGDFFGSAYWTYYKAVPCRDGSMAYSPCEPLTKGAFPATVAQEGWLPEYGDKTWERTVFPHQSKVVLINPKKDEPLTLLTVSGMVSKGEPTFSAIFKEDGKNRYMVKNVSDYRLATQEEVSQWEQQQLETKVA